MTTSPKRTRYRKPVGSKLEKILAVVFGLFALLVVNAVYLTAIRVVEKVSGETYQNWFYILMFLGHLVLGLLIILPVIAFGIGHIRNAHNRPNKRAVQVGYALFVTALILLASGVVLTRVEGVIVVKDPAVRSVAYWLHVLTPLVAGWLFVLHRLAGRKIKWRIGARWAVVAAVFAGAMVVLQTQDPRSWNQEGPESGEQYFFPSLARTATGNFIPERVLMNDQYCQECHGDVHERWENGVHHLSSFNNPPYLASVRETRRVATVQAARFCAGCHDPVVFFGGKFDDPEFDDVNDPAGQAGITCTTCHAITHINSPRGNSDYTIEEPVHYPFAFSKNRTLAWTAGQGEAGSAQEDLPEAAPQDAGILRQLPQGAPAGGTEQLQMVAGAESLRSLPPERGLRPRGQQFLLPTQSPGQLQRLPHAGQGVGRLRCPGAG